MEAYNLHLRNAAYHCGGLMAVYAAIQRTAMPDVNTGIVERYYASAIQMPALVIGQLSSRSNHHLEKIENGWLADKYREKLQEISVALGTSIPATLNLEQQSYLRWATIRWARSSIRRETETSPPPKKRPARQKNKRRSILWQFRTDMSSCITLRAQIVTRTETRTWAICPGSIRRPCRASSPTLQPSAAFEITWSWPIRASPA